MSRPRAADEAFRDIERARPLLGTRVAVRVQGLPPERAHVAIDRAFAEVERVHGLMSFHEPDSDLGRLNREAAAAPVPVHGMTYRVLRSALQVAAASRGLFEPCIAPRLVARGLLPRPRGAPVPDLQADWRDVQLLADARVRFRRPLWLDLGGIAKGYAVDRASAALRAAGARGGCVDAGGDLRVFGPAEHVVLLRTEHAAAARDSIAVLRLRGGALASSAGEVGAAGGSAGRRCGMPFDPRSGRPHRGVGVSVVAARAWLADALTKVALGDPQGCAAALEAFGARAYCRLSAPTPVRETMSGPRP